MKDIYLSSNILVGYDDGTTWLLSDQKPENEGTPPSITTFVITACDPRSIKATLEENHLDTLALEQDLIKNGFTYHIGWGSSQDNLHAELSFCVPVSEPETVNATRHLLTELAKDYGQNAIFEVNGQRVTLLPCLDPEAKGEVIKFATQLAEPQSKFRNLLDALRWITELEPNQFRTLDELTNN